MATGIAVPNSLRQGIVEFMEAIFDMRPLHQFVLKPYLVKGGVSDQVCHLGEVAKLSRLLVAILNELIER